MAIKTKKKDDVKVSPMLEPGFTKHSLSSMSIERRRNFEADLIRFGVIHKNPTTSELILPSPLVVQPYGTKTTMTGEIRFLELAKNGTAYAGLRSPDSMNSNHVWTLPSADGSPGQCLVTNGSHSLSWADLEGQCYWIKDGDNIYYGEGAVQIFNLTDSDKDSILQFGLGVTSTVKWTVGTDDSDSDMFKIASGSALGTNDVLKITASGTNYAKDCLVALGYGAMASITTGWRNVAIGYYAQNAMTEGRQQIAIGWYAQGTYPATGQDCIAIGTQAQYILQGGEYDIAIGKSSQLNISSGSYNASVGYYTLAALTTGNYNTAVGDHALAGADSSYATAIGAFAGQTKTTETGGIYVGYMAGNGDTDANRLYIDGLERVGTIPARRELAFIYGIYAAAVADQYLWVNAHLKQPASAYHNWGTTFGTDGYGIRDNAGNIEIKNSGGSWASPLFSVAAHNVLSTAHGDATAAACVRGHLITGQGAVTPLWTALAKGTAGYFLKADANDVVWAAHGLTATDVGAEPALGNPGVSGYVLSSTDGGVRSWIAAGGALALDDLTDVDATSPSDNDILRYDTAGGVWQHEALPAAANHDLLSATHGDTTAAAVVRGDIIIGSGATPKWTRLAKGTANQVLTMGADEPAWAAAGAGYAPAAAKYIVQEAHADLSAEQSLGALATGIVLNTTTAGVGVLSIATGTDLPDAEVIRMHEQVSAPSTVASHGQLYVGPYNYYTKLLLHCNGSDEGTTFTDECGKTVTANGDANTEQAEKKFGNASAQLSGTGYLTLASSDDFKFGTADFTIDLWVYPTSFAGEMCLVDALVLGGAGARTDAFVLVVTATNGNLRIYKSGGYSSSTSGALTINTWNHVAVANISGTFKFFIGGTLDATTTTIPSVTSGGLVIGRYADSAGGYFVGYMDEIRVSKGIARWTATFTPEIAEYTTTGEKALLFKSGTGVVTALAPAD
ncbi:MAG: LamG-like jellyroll fold domain-containing protein [Dehalococcoidia bacterium]|jgi:hypothetical protein